MEAPRESERATAGAGRPVQYGAAGLLGLVELEPCRHTHPRINDTLRTGRPPNGLLRCAALHRTAPHAAYNATTAAEASQAGLLIVRRQKPQAAQRAHSRVESKRASSRLGSGHTNGIRLGGSTGTLPPAALARDGSSLAGALQDAPH
jgi:hypothetical protein